MTRGKLCLWFFPFLLRSFEEPGEDFLAITTTNSHEPLVELNVLLDEFRAETRSNYNVRDRTSINPPSRYDCCAASVQNVFPPEPVSYKEAVASVDNEK